MRAIVYTLVVIAALAVSEAAAWGVTLPKRQARRRDRCPCPAKDCTIPCSACCAPGPCPCDPTGCHR